MKRPYTLPEPLVHPSSFVLTRPSGHRTDAHRERLYGKIEPMESPWRPWWRVW